MIRSCRKTFLPLFRASALVAGMLTGYYHRVFAGSCNPTGAGTYSCTNPANSATDGEQTINIASPLTVTTDAGFGIDTSGNAGEDALNLTATGGLIFTDANASTITGHDNGIYAYNDSSGSLSITSSGTVTGTAANGIDAQNYGTDLSISVVDVSGGLIGIAAINDGSGALSITSSGTVAGAAVYGIAAVNYGASLSISAVDVNGGVFGILAYNYGNDALSISTSGTVMGGYRGIHAINFGTDLNISVANVTGGYDGIYAINVAGGSLSITTSGTVTGSGGAGIYALNVGGPLDITVGAASLVQGDGAGIMAYAGVSAPGSGQPITITVDGRVRNISGSPSDDAIVADGGPVTLNLNAGSVTTGIISLGSYDDTVNLAGTLNGMADGGDGTDTLAFNNVGTVNSSHYLNFENLNINGGSTTLTGTWDFSGGTTTVYNGSLYVNGRLSTTLLTVGQNGLLGGSGSILGDVKAYGVVSPGNSIGTLTVNGSVYFMSGSTFMVELGADGRSDKLKVGGSVSIHNSELAVSLARALYPDGTRWHILTADRGIHGRFSSISTNFTSSTLALEPIYTGGSLDLVLDRTPYASFAATDNQAAVGSALNQLLPSARGDMADLLLEMDFAMNPAELSGTLKGLNPEIYTSFGPSGLSIAGIFNRVAALRQEELYWNPIAADGDREQLWSVWGRAIGSRLDRDGEDGISGDALVTGGDVSGMDRAFDSTVRAGLMLGYSSSDLSWDESEDNGSITGKHIELYSSAQYKDFSIGGRLGYTRLDNGAYRFIETPVFTTGAGGNFSSNVVDATLSGSYGLSFGKIHLDPKDSIDYLYLDQNGFTENGAGDFALHVDSKAADTLSGALGLRLFGLFDGSTGWHFRPTAGLSFVHWFKNDAMTLNSNFVDYPGANLTMTGADPADNGMLASLGLSVDYNRRLSLFLNYDSAFADGATTQMVSGGLVWQF